MNTPAIGDLHENSPQHSYEVLATGSPESQKPVHQLDSLPSQMPPDMRQGSTSDMRRGSTSDIRKELTPDIRKELTPDIRKESTSDMNQGSKEELQQMSPVIRKDSTPEIKHSSSPSELANTGGIPGAVCSTNPKPSPITKQTPPTSIETNSERFNSSTEAKEALMDFPAANSLQYTEIALQIEKERTKQTELKCELAKLVMDLIKSTEKSDMTPELLRRMFLSDEPVDYTQHLHYTKAQMQGAGRPAPGGDKPETPLPQSPPIPSSATYGTLGCSSGVNSAMSSQASHSRSSSGRSFNPSACDSIDEGAGCTERAERPERADTGMGPIVPSEPLDRTAHDRPMPTYSQKTFPFYYSHVDGSGQAGAVALTSQHMHANAQPMPTPTAAGFPAAASASSQAKSDDGLGSPYSNNKYPQAFQSSPAFRPSNQESPRSSAAHSPQMQVAGLVSHAQSHVPGQSQMTGMQHAATSQVQMFQAGSMAPHALHTTVMPGAGAATHAPGATQPVYYMNPQPPLSAPMIPSQYYVPNNMGPWKLMPIPTEKRRDDDEPHVSKKAKTGKNNLNFMISTPKNPPAKKYNK